MRQCKVFVHDVEAGILQETDDRQYIFTYQDGYAGAPVCIAMPVRTEPYRSAHLFPYFFNMLSEGACLRRVEGLSADDRLHHQQDGSE